MTAILAAAAVSVILQIPGEVLNVKTTGYCPGPPCVDSKWADGKTATGTTARIGVCAANWDTFKPGMVFEVPGYGVCRVEDTGNPNYVKGLHLDLYFDSEKDGRNWGVQYLPVRLLEVPVDYKPHIFYEDD